MARGDFMDGLEILLCFLASVGAITVLWALAGRFLRPSDGDIFVLVDLNQIPQRRWECTLRYCNWLWGFGLLPGRVHLTWRGGDAPLLDSLLRAYPFVIYDGGTARREVER